MTNGQTISSYTVQYCTASTTTAATDATATDATSTAASPAARTAVANTPSTTRGRATATATATACVWQNFTLHNEALVTIGNRRLHWFDLGTGGGTGIDVNQPGVFFRVVLRTLPLVPPHVGHGHGRGHSHGHGHGHGGSGAGIDSGAKADAQAEAGTQWHAPCLRSAKVFDWTGAEFDSLLTSIQKIK
jgi:hypothetical protein